jgi:two-component system, cell cycle response regulator
VTDRVMSGVDGLELSRRIRSHPRDGYASIIMVTGLGSQDDVLKGMASGADDYLIKPVDPFALRVRLMVAERVSALHGRLAEAQRTLETLNAGLAQLASTDALTGVGNRRRFDLDLDAVHARAVRSGQPYSLALLDLDRFKPYNDALGHQAGDEALREVARCVAEQCRQGDEVYRYGGEELAVLFHGDGLPDTLVAGERIRAAVEALAIPHPTTGVITISVGMSHVSSAEDLDSRSVVAAADTALYRAKDAGRNRVEGQVPVEDAASYRR